MNVKKIRQTNGQRVKRTNGRTDKRTGQKLYAPDLSMRGHKKVLCQIPVISPYCNSAFKSGLFQDGKRIVCRVNVSKEHCTV